MKTKPHPAYVVFLPCCACEEDESKFKGLLKSVGQCDLRLSLFLLV